jgi:hypothetical protein
MAGWETSRRSLCLALKHWPPSRSANGEEMASDPRGPVAMWELPGHCRGYHRCALPMMLLNDLALTPTTTAATMGLSKPQFSYRNHCRSCNHDHAT